MRASRHIEIRTLTTGAERAEAVRLEREIWGFEETELIPVHLFTVAGKVGGQTFGAYDGGRMAGFLLAIPALKPGGKIYLHSHMLGVLTEYRDRGIGRLLKLRQREDALARGRSPWSSGLSIRSRSRTPISIWRRLGAIVRRYVPNQYGTTTSPLHGGLPTDRCVAEWWLDRARACGARPGGQPPRPPVEARISVPAAIAALRRR